MVVGLHLQTDTVVLIEFDDADRIFKGLLQRKVIVRNRDKVIRNCLRITIGSKEENNALIDALNELA